MSSTTIQSSSFAPLPEISPLVVRKSQSNDSPSRYDTDAAPAPHRPASRPLPMTPERRGRLPKIQIPPKDANSSSSMNDFFYDTRPGLGGNETIQSFKAAGTVRPLPVPTLRMKESIELLEAKIDDIKLSRSRPSSKDRSDSSSTGVPAAGSEDEKDLPPIPVEWSDNVLEELMMVGEGASGTVDKVKDKRTGLLMARKTVATREAPLKQLLRELNMITRKSHPNIVKFYGAYFSRSSGEVKMLMEFCEGGSLEGVGKMYREKQARVEERIAGKLAEGILSGLAYLHSQKIIHRDIKPSNVLLSSHGQVKLCDFGVSGELVDSMADTFTGSRLYMAPERILGKEYSIRADVWSTGLTLLELVQNKFPIPFDDMAPIEVMIFITKNEPPKLQDEPGTTWTEDMKDFIKATLTVCASDRATPAQMLRHPWLVQVQQQQVDMAGWIRQVREWE